MLEKVVVASWGQALRVKKQRGEPIVLLQSSPKRVVLLYERVKIDPEVTKKHFMSRIALNYGSSG